MLIYVALTLALSIGYMAQATGLCLVRGVSDLMQGHAVRFLAIVTSGYWLCAYLPLLNDSEIPLLLARHGFHWIYLAGGLIFGLGAAVNGGCTVSTVSRFSSGDLRMFFTMLGWLAGWILLDSTGFDFTPQVLGQLHPLLVWLPVMGLLVITIVFNVKVFNINVFNVKPFDHRRLWNGVMFFGVMSGALFVIQPQWPPSDLIHDLSLEILQQSGLPSIERILIAIMLLLGMSIGALYNRKFAWLPVNIIAAIKHLSGGILMGIGANLSLGGNDIQILLALPAISPAGFTSLIGMASGIWIGLLVINRLNPGIAQVNA